MVARAMRRAHSPNYHGRFDRRGVRPSHFGAAAEVQRNDMDQPVCDWVQNLFICRCFRVHHGYLFLLLQQEEKCVLQIEGPRAVGR